MSASLLRRSSRSTRSHLKAFVWLLLGLAACGSAQAATFYVRTDGGDASQCTGKTNTAYPGSGTAQACAWSSPHIAFPSSAAARIAGGDTLIIGSGSYMIGWGAPGAAGGRCYSGGPYDCYLAPIPSGPSATAKTRILGQGHDTGCAVAPKLWGTERVGTVLNLDGSSNVEVACLEVTDKSDCVEFHSNTGAKCERNTAPYGQWASTGLSASNSRNVALRDVNIHGLAHTGIHAGGLTDWTLDRVKINANGWIGWDGDIGAASSNAGQIALRNVEIAWNGCGERWQTGAAWACWAQTAGGYGDGLGTAKTGGQWLIEDSFIHHNTSDGLDLLYMDGAANSSVTVRRVHAVGNAGNQIKTLGTTTIENSVVVGNCAYFNGKDSMTSDDQCRALGNALSLGLVAGQTATIRHNTITGEGDCLILTEGGTSTSTLNIQNNTLVGQIDWRGNATGTPGELSCGHYAYNSPGAVNYAGNLFWNVKQGQCPSGSLCGQDPKLANSTLASFDATPLAGSPLIDKALIIAGVSTDFLLQPRPVGAGPDIGALEVQSGGSTPPPACTRAAPTLSLSAPTAAVAAGSTVNYTVSLRNNDSSTCSTTAFSLARSIPTGWTGTLAATSFSLAPSASSTTTLSVTSTSDAAAGSNSIGSGASSGVGSSHTANASATYTVATSTPPPTCTRATPTISLSGPTSAVAAGSTVNYTVNLRNNDGSACTSTSFSLARSVPTGWTGTLAVSSLSLAPGASSSTTLSAISASNAAAGSYGIGTGASSSVGSSHTANASGMYTVSAPAPPSNTLTESVATDKTSYLRGETVYMSARVLQGGQPARGVRVVFTVTKPNGAVVNRKATSGSDGYARNALSLGRRTATGTYQLLAVATSGSTQATANASFVVH